MSGVRLERFHQGAPPVNEGEIEVLRRLRDQLSDSWWVVANFEFPAKGGRWYECDALAINELGYCYLIETKAWTGHITGSDGGWLLPSLDGRSMTHKEAPVHVLTAKQKKLASWLGDEVPGAGPPIRIFPLVVVVTDAQPELRGKSAAITVTHDGMIGRLEVDPRSADQVHDKAEAAEKARQVFETLRQMSRPPTSTVIRDYELDELEELREDGTEIWQCHVSADPKIVGRLKRYRIDTLAPPDERETQLQRARQDYQVLEGLLPEDIVPLLTVPFEEGGEFITVSRMPRGESLLQVLTLGELDAEVVVECVAEMYRVLARIHERGVTHRNIRPASIWLNPVTGEVQYSDFDFSRVERRQGITQLVVSNPADPEYAAPEVLKDFAAADQRSDVYSLAVVCSKLIAAHPAAKLTESLSKVLDDCLSDNPSARPENAGDVVQRIAVSSQRVTSFEEQDVLDDRYVVRSRHAGGALTIVYRLFDNLTRTECGAKFVRAEYAQQLKASTEWELLHSVPDHQNIAKPIYVGRMHSVRRGSAAIPHNEDFLITDWIDGRPLDHYIDQALPEARILQIAADVLDGLSHLHTHGVLHRDIKPDNVMVRPNGRAVILDFNVSALDASDLTTQLGTPAYRAPEVPSDGWSKAADLYSVGVLITELLAGSRMGGEARNWAADVDNQVSPEILDVLVQLLDVEPSKRGTAAGLTTRCRDLAEMSQTRRTSLPDPPAIGAQAEGNPFVERLMGYFSQSVVSNAGTRGQDAFSKWMYVETEIDRRLKRSILEGKPALVIVTGNAGDGKTAFIREVEAELGSMAGAAIDYKVGGNGSMIRVGSHVWRSNWDGSQDEEGLDNGEVLEEFFSSFQGDAIDPPSDQTFVIAINEGRLVDFLTQHHDRFGALDKLVNELFTGGGAETPEWFTLVNLNRRVLTADGPNNVLKQLVERFTDQRLWSQCASCPAVEVCPSRSNALMLRDPILGTRATERIRETIDLVRLRRRMHITTRDLLSALAYILVGNRTCNDIVELANRADTATLARGHLYNRMFAANEAQPEENAEKDRLLAEIGVLDVAETAQPELDGRLWLLGLGAIKQDPDGLERSDRTLIETLIKSEGSTGRLSAHRYLRRKLYLETEDPAYLDMLPYRYLREFTESLANPQPTTAHNIAEAVSASEGLRDVPGMIAVRLVDDLEARERSYVTRPVDDFSLTVVDESATAPMVEYRNELLRFTSLHDQTLALDIDIDIFEALMRMQQGFTPSREDLRGSWLSLATFKERLASIPSRELLLRSATGTRTRIAVSEDGLIRAEVAT